MEVYDMLNVMNWTANDMGRKGAKRRNEVLTKEQRHDIAVKAGRAKKGVKHKKKRVFHKLVNLIVSESLT